jgi:hypothetical protein
MLGAATPASPTSGAGNAAGEGTGGTGSGTGGATGTTGGGSSGTGQSGGGAIGGATDGDSGQSAGGGVSGGGADPTAGGAGVTFGLARIGSGIVDAVDSTPIGTSPAGRATRSLPTTGVGGLSTLVLLAFLLLGVGVVARRFGSRRA